MPLKILDQTNRELIMPILGVGHLWMRSLLDFGLNEHNSKNSREAIAALDALDLTQIF